MWKHRNRVELLEAELKAERKLRHKLQQQMAHAADQRFPNHAYNKGWFDCLRYLNIPIKEAQGDKPRNAPATQARQSRFTTYTNPGPVPGPPSVPE